MKKLFIVGCPRSGTTVVQQALNRHSEIVIPPETKFFYYFYGQPRSRQAAHLRRINRDLQIRIPPPDRRIRAPRDAKGFYDRIAQAYLERLGRTNVTYFGDKTPEHTGQLHRIHKVFPDAKILFVYRDGRDVAVSLNAMPWIRCDVYVGFVVWLYYYRVLKKARHDVSLDMLAVKYEDLVRNPAVEFDKVLRFLGLRYEARVAEGYGNREGIPRREYPWKSRALERITTDRVDLWRRELSSAQVERIERLGRHALRDLGYELSNTAASRLSPWFIARLGWGLARCAAGLPLCCLANEILGSAALCRCRPSADGRESLRAPTTARIAKVCPNRADRTGSPSDPVGAGGASSSRRSATVGKSGGP